MAKLHPADILIAAGLALTGTGLYFVYPTATPYYILTIGVIMCMLGGIGIVKGRGRK